MFGSSKLKTPNKLREETPNRFGTFLKNRKNKVWGFLLDKVRKVKGEWEPEMSGDTSPALSITTLYAYPSIK
jgi:hypothetical protein